MDPHWFQVRNPYDGFGAYKKLVIDYIDQLDTEGVVNKFEAAPKIAHRFRISENMAKDWIMDWIGVRYWRNTYGNNKG
jgi:hypothetical protein